ncbi:MAG: phosphate ABC transporter permease PstA [Thermomicrobiales bacterium]
MSARITDRIATAVIWILSAGIVGLLASFLLYLVVKGGRYLTLHFITAAPAIVAGGGVGPPLFNSIYLLFLTMLISIPLGVGAGIYMAEFAPANRLTDVIRTATETLASLPSIIVGLFGLLLFVQRLHMGFSVLAGALALTVFNLPVIERVTETSLRALPSGLREGSLALGMTRWQTIRTVLLPSALPGLVTGFILTAGRIFGEAAALLFTAGQSSAELNWHDISLFSDTSPIGLFRPAETLAVHIWKLNSEGLVPDYRHIADGAAALLILFVLAFNVIARFFGRWLHRRITAT